ncbi:MAG: MGMT family protein [Bryobacteraceae bacterium]|nr:MGMT family protein [Bryobacteraceae bacterium]
MKLEDFLTVVRRIPRGKVMTYGGVAEAAGHPGAARQVVWSLNQSAPGIPWHRVVGAGLKIRLTGEPGLEQRLRLETEGWRVQGTKLIRSEDQLKSELKPPRAASRKNTSKAG